MDAFLEAATSYPTAIYSTLLVVVLFYWLLAMKGLLDFSHSNVDVDIHLHAHGEPGELSALASCVVALGLNGVPFSVVVSLLVLFSWALSCVSGQWLLPLAPTGLLQMLASAGTLVMSFVLALPLTAWAIRPMRGLFVTHEAPTNADLVGSTCLVLSQGVDQDFGHAEVAQRGSNIKIRIWSRDANTLSKGCEARIMEYDAAKGRYRVEGTQRLPH